MGPWTGHSFLLVNDTAAKLVRQGALLLPSAIPCSLFPLISRIHSSLFSNWRRSVSSKFFDTQVPSRNLSSLVTLDVFSLVFAATDTAYCYLSRIGRIKIFSCSIYGHLSSLSALSSYGIFALLTLWRLSVSLRPLV